MLLVLALLLCSLAACGASAAAETKTETPVPEGSAPEETANTEAITETKEEGTVTGMTGGMMMGNPWTDCESREEAEKAVAEMIEKVRDYVGKYIYSTEGEEREDE